MPSVEAPMKRHRLQDGYLMLLSPWIDWYWQHFQFHIFMNWISNRAFFEEAKFKHTKCYGAEGVLGEFCRFFVLQLIAALRALTNRNGG